ncbi:EXS family-domain-containing protein [Nemania sp. FL0916]|nr:EXS family-domain-containing protein [Nemania sp. FL0916]
MDGDPAVESELDSFSLTFPLPYRVAFIVVLAVWGWGLNLHYLHMLKIDVPALIRYPGRPSPHHPPHHRSVYRLAAVLSCIFGFSLFVFWIFTRRDKDLVLAWDWLPLTYLAVLLAFVAVPLPRTAGLPHAGRARLRSMVRRIALGGIAEAKDGKFGDILLADVLTSYAKVLGDLYVAVCMFLRTGGSATARPDRGCGGVVVIPLILALPSLIRLRQCLIEYGRVRRGPLNKEATGWGGQHLANALKYSTAFPVILFSALQRNWMPDSAAVYRLWVAACTVNSLYSFYWDVAKDWDLTLFNSAVRSRKSSSGSNNNNPDYSHSSSGPFGLRRTLRLGPPQLYYGVVALDLVLRCTWSLKLSPHLDRVADFESSIFVVELLEVLRRWIWIFLRVETEWIRNNNSTNGPAIGLGLGLGLGMDDIMLGDFQNRYEDED